MTREELKAHCEKEIEMCEFWARVKSEELNNSKIYQEHKLILELLEQEPTLDKIRSEIEDLTYYWCEVNPRTVIDEVLDIIDKYRESEE